MSDEIKVQEKRKNSKIIVAMVAAVIAVLTILAIVLVSSSGATAKKVKEQLSLGEKYLTELDYEQAIAAYELAIELDPKCEEAYLGLAEVYIAAGEFDKAEEILDKAEEALGKETEGIKELREKMKKESEGEENRLNGEAEITAKPEPTVAPSPTPLPTATPVPSPTPTPTPLPTATPIPSPTPLPTATPSPTPTPRPTATPTPSPSPTPTPLPFPNTSDVTVSEPVVFSLPEEDSEQVVLFDVEQESSAVEVTIFSESGSFDANVSYYIGKILEDGTVESVGELGVSMYASDAFKKNTTKSFYIADAGQYGIYIKNAVSYNPHYYSGTNANELQVTYKILPADINEPNGTEDTATKIKEDEYCFFNLLGEKDTDYFVLELTEDYDKLEFSIISETGTFDSKIVYSVSRYNEESEKMESVGSVWGMYAMNAFNRNSTKTYKINGAGKYYIEVTNAANANSLYYGGDNETYLAIKCKGIKE